MPEDDKCDGDDLQVAWQTFYVQVKQSDLSLDAGGMFKMDKGVILTVSNNR